MAEWAVGFLQTPCSQRSSYLWREHVSIEIPSWMNIIGFLLVSRNLFHINISSINPSITASNSLSMDWGSGNIKNLTAWKKRGGVQMSSKK